MGVGTWDLSVDGRVLATWQGTTVKSEVFTFPWVVGELFFTPDGTHLMTKNSNYTGYVLRLGGVAKTAERKK